MTCIAALIADDGVWMGGDAACLSGARRDVLVTPKVWRAGPYLLGAAGGGRFCDVVRYAFAPPVPERAPVDWMAFLVGPWVTALRAALAETGAAQKATDGSDQGFSGGDLLIGVAGRLFWLDCAYSPSETRWPYTAIGTGAPYALGALSVTSEFDPALRLESALIAAARHCADVAEPFTIMHLEGDPRD